MKRIFENLCREHISLESVLLGQSPQLHLGWIGLLYKKYKIGNWNKTIPKASSLDDKTYLMWDSECYCLFHKQHKKFGQEIIECAHSYVENIFVFLTILYYNQLLIL